jgi:hypothetical protein
MARETRKVATRGVDLTFVWAAPRIPGGRRRANVECKTTRESKFPGVPWL